MVVNNKNNKGFSMSFQRDPFLICKVSQILSSKIATYSETTPILIDSKTEEPINFVKLYGIITDKLSEINDSNPEFSIYYLKLDDGTGAIWLKSNSPFMIDIQKWDFVQVIGNLILEILDNGLFDVIINPESITQMEDKSWELVHNLDVKLIHSKAVKPKKAKANREESKPSNSPEIARSSTNNSNSKPKSESPKLDTLTDRIEKILRTNDSGDGIEFSEIVKLLENTNDSEVDDILFELAYEGRVYQPKPDYYKIMD